MYFKTYDVFFAFTFTKHIKLIFSPMPKQMSWLDAKIMELKSRQGGTMPDVKSRDQNSKFFNHKTGKTVATFNHGMCHILLDPKNKSAQEFLIYR
jgi:hypothetical protein